MQVPDLSIPPGLEEAYFKVVQFGSAVGQNVILLRRSSPARSRFWTVGMRSLFVRFKSLWASFNNLRRSRWTVFWTSLPFGSHAGLNGYPGSGYSAFIYLNAPRYQRNLSILLDPPFPIFGSISFSPDKYPDVFTSFMFLPSNGYFYSFSLNFSNSSNSVWRSVDGGHNFSKLSTPGNNTQFPVLYRSDTGLFYAFPNRFTTTMKTSPDGITWTSHTVPFFFDVKTIAYSPSKNLFVAVGLDFGVGFSMTSLNGITWTKHNLGSSKQFTWVRWEPQLNVFLCMLTGIGGPYLYKTVDGVNFTQIPLPVGSNPSIPTFSTFGPTFGILCDQGISHSWYTFDTNFNFTPHSSPLFDVLFPPNWIEEFSIWIATGYRSSVYKIYYSFDGKTWALATASQVSAWGYYLYVPSLGQIFVSNQGQLVRRSFTA